MQRLTGNIQTDDASSFRSPVLSLGEILAFVEKVISFWKSLVNVALELK